MSLPPSIQRRRQGMGGGVVFGKAKDIAKKQHSLVQTQTVPVIASIQSTSVSVSNDMFSHSNGISKGNASGSSTVSPSKNKASKASTLCIRPSTSSSSSSVAASRNDSTITPTTTVLASATTSTANGSNINLHKSLDVSSPIRSTHKILMDNMTNGNHRNRKASLPPAALVSIDSRSSSSSSSSSDRNRAHAIDHATFTKAIDISTKPMSASVAVAVAVSSLDKKKHSTIKSNIKQACSTVDTRSSNNSIAASDMSAETVTLKPRDKHVDLLGSTPQKILENIWANVNEQIDYNCDHTDLQLLDHLIHNQMVSTNSDDDNSYDNHSHNTNDVIDRGIRRSCLPVPLCILKSNSEKRSADYISFNKMNSIVAKHGGCDESYADTLSHMKYDYNMLHEQIITKVPTAADHSFMDDILGVDNGVDMVVSTVDVKDNVVQLGKRGRWYQDVWDEERYLLHHYPNGFNNGSIGSSSNNSSSHDYKDDVLYHWSDLFHDTYSDNFDGEYRHWTVRSLEKTKKARKTRVSGSRNQAGNQEVDESIILYPPVPSALLHPASWSLHPRRAVAVGSDDDEGVDYSCIHPAYDINKNSHTSKSAPCRVPQEVVDDFTLLANIASQQLQTISYTNQRSLMKLQRLCMQSKNVDSIRKKRKLLGDMLVAINNRHASKVKYLFRPESMRQDQQMPVDSTCSKSPTNSGEHKYSTRISTGTIVKSRWSGPDKDPRSMIDDDELSYDVPESEKYQQLVGACLYNHVPHAHFVATLKVGAYVEVLTQQKWCIGVLVRCYVDNNLLLRHVKVKLLYTFDSDSTVVAVEDGRIAPLGTNTDWKNVR